MVGSIKKKPIIEKKIRIENKTKDKTWPLG
jgi:hypothetical protein